MWGLSMSDESKIINDVLKQPFFFFLQW
jgi:hypothetical protein